MCQRNLMDAFAVFWMQQFTICYLRQGPSVESGLFNFFYSYISNINNVSSQILPSYITTEAYISVQCPWFSIFLTHDLYNASPQKEVHSSAAFSSSLLVMDSFSVSSLFSSLSVKAKLCSSAFRSNWFPQFIIQNKKISLKVWEWKCILFKEYNGTIVILFFLKKKPHNNVMPRLT